MSILKLMHKPLQVHITKLARKNCTLKYGDDLASLMFEFVKNVEPENINEPVKTVFQRFVDRFRPKKEFSINISSDDKSNFFVNSNLRVGRHNFVSQKHPFDFAETLHTLKGFRKTVEMTRDDVLERLGEFNRLRHGLKKNLFNKNS